MALSSDSRELQYLNADSRFSPRSNDDDADDDDGTDSAGTTLFPRHRKDNLRYYGIVCCLPSTLVVVVGAILIVAMTGKNQQLRTRSALDQTAENLQSTRQVLETYCYEVPEGKCVESCCPAGFACWQNDDEAGATYISKKLHHLVDSMTPGPEPPEFCSAKHYTASDVCVSATDSECAALVDKIEEVTHSWDLIITSGGGGGHLSAAKNVGDDVKRAWRYSIDDVKGQLQEMKSDALLKPQSLVEVMQTLDSVRARSSPVEMVDIMNSPCTSLLGELGLHVGGAMEGMWDTAQREGNVARLKFLAQPRNNLLMNQVFGRQCHEYMHSVLVNHRLPREGRPSKVISTEPVFLWPIVKTATAAGFTVHQYMTDLPGPGALNFFAPIKNMMDAHPGKSQHFFLHTIAPTHGDVYDIAVETHLPVSQIIVERFMPVSLKFQDGTFPKPGEACTITIKAQLPEEEEFLGGQERTFPVAAEDTVALVMMGSQPTGSALFEYLNQIQLLARTGPHTLWFFMACGPHKKEEYAKIYADMARRATAFNEDQIVKGQALRVVPFTGQPAQMIEGRAEVTVTRSGGMTAGELLALGERGDKRLVLIHVEGDVTTAPSDPAEFALWEENILQDKMVPWEANNARYLLDKVGAKLVTPFSFANIMRQELDE